MILQCVLTTIRTGLAPKGHVVSRPYPTSIPTLTALRFFAAIWVVTLHYTQWLPDKGANRPPLITNGALGVDFFFILSGFILAHAHRAQILEQRIAIRSFLVKRLAKIYPMHLATLLFYLSLITAIGLAHLKFPNPERYQAGQFVLNLLLVHAWQVRDAGGWNYPSWSVSAEWFAYLIFPFVAPFLILRLRALPVEWLLGVAIAFLLSVWALAMPLFGVDFFSLHSNFGYMRILPEFILGIVLYRLGTERWMRWLESPWALPLLVAGVVVLAAFDNMQIVVVLVIAVIILAAAERARQGASGILAARPLVYLGEISYSLYMIHLPVATLLLQGVRLKMGYTPLPAVLAAYPIAMLVAVASYHLLEKPAHRYLLRFAKPRTRELRASG
jgi:peptidoglycan/LPS O-acetylase OafA/YrhL